MFLFLFSKGLELGQVNERDLRAAGSQESRVLFPSRNTSNVLRLRQP